MSLGEIIFFKRSNGKCQLNIWGRKSTYSPTRNILIWRKGVFYVQGGHNGVGSLVYDGRTLCGRYSGLEDGSADVGHMAD